MHPEQPDRFRFTTKNLSWVKNQIKKYPVGRQASAVIPVLWRAQEQEGWVSRPAIESVAEILKMAPIRVFEIASFYYMFHLSPVGSVAHFQVCGTTPCMLRNSEDLITVCKKRISHEPNSLSKDKKFSWEEVECLGACANAPVCQIGKDYYEDLSKETFLGVIEALDRGQLPKPGSQIARFASEPNGGLTSLKGKKKNKLNASVTRAIALKDSIKRIE
tara:strand:- start:132 stop:785 length:654 start_codon:yes stop_codon:yes gene_type:complete